MKIVCSLFLAASATAFQISSPGAFSTGLKSFTYGGPDGGSARGASKAPGPPVQAQRSAPPPPGAKQQQSQASSGADILLTKDKLDHDDAVIVQGGSLRTYSFGDPFVERAQLMLTTEGRPLNANIELWHGPDNTPQKMAIYSEDGALRPISLLVETPRSDNAVCIRNTGHLEFPLSAWVAPDDGKSSRGAGTVLKDLAAATSPKTIQGGALHTYPFDPAVSAVQILIKTDGRPLNARIELMQGPNNNKQVMEIYTEDGMERPFFSVIETPGTGNVVRVVNTATVEFPMYAVVEPFSVDTSATGGGGQGWDKGGNNALNRGWDNGAADNFKSQW